MNEIIDLVRAAARIRILFLPHAVRQMSRPDRILEGVRNCIILGEVIEDYPKDARGHSCLLLGPPDPAARSMWCARLNRIPVHHHRLSTRSEGMGEQLEKQEAIMKCMHCQGTMNRGAAPIHIDRNGYHLLLDAVPAWVCQQQCGEPYFGEREVESIQGLLAQVDEQMARLAPAA